MQTPPPVSDTFDASCPNRVDLLYVSGSSMCPHRRMSGTNTRPKCALCVRYTGFERTVYRKTPLDSHKEQIHCARHNRSPVRGGRGRSLNVSAMLHIKKSHDANDVVRTHPSHDHVFSPSWVQRARVWWDKGSLRIFERLWAPKTFQQLPLASQRRSDDRLDPYCTPGLPCYEPKAERSATPITKNVSEGQIYCDCIAQRTGVPHRELAGRR